MYTNACRWHLRHLMSILHKSDDISTHLLLPPFASEIHEIQFAGRSTTLPAMEVHLCIHYSPNASEPVRDEGERGHEEDEDGRAVLRVAVDLARHAHQPQQPRRLQQPDQGRRLQE